uniref:Uncharacterized protein n=1 Tax=Candidatus Kentrum sp. FM TaxID=2126340 RepID=A0A450TXB4_9GAMM|nr:MAG: hypothetical protein BECKFM1743C_GA0114222_107622 [Candidatus Kentron sp. FM]VFK12715.1 MAG: hypothetical protein BECKFM1743B_GA0114221_102525 [Candidatus Kentron sp. FM]
MLELILSHRGNILFLTGLVRRAFLPLYGELYAKVILYP